MSTLSRPADARSASTVVTAFVAVSALAVVAAPKHAHGDDFDIPPGTSVAVSSGGHGHLRADGHAPIGVMGEHLHKQGEWMVSYRYMRMFMEGNRIGTRKVSPEDIAGNVVNRNPVVNPAGVSVVPPTMRVVPTKMTMDMHMFGGMYAPTNDLTLMVMLPYIRKSMDHLTFAAMPARNTNIIGGFTTESEGFGDLKFSGLYRLYDDAVHHLHLNMGISAPTGSITERDTILDPFRRTPNVRLPYAMQIGTGTWDLLPGLTYTARSGDLSWGGQYRAEVRLEDENDEGYAWGDKHMATGWLAYQFAPWIATSFRANYMTQSEIDGSDPMIGGPVQTAHPEFYGFDRLDLLAGVNLMGQSGALRGHRLAIEFGVPVYQDLNGPQLETDWLFTIGWQKAF